jgi:hypothetical protein
VRDGRKRKVLGTFHRYCGVMGIPDWHMPTGNSLILAYSWLAYAIHEWEGF